MIKKIPHLLPLSVILSGFLVMSSAQAQDIFGLYSGQNNATAAAPFDMNDYSTIQSQCSHFSQHNQTVCPGIDVLRGSYDTNYKPPSEPPQVSELVTIQTLTDVPVGNAATNGGGTTTDQQNNFFDSFGPQ